MMTKLDDDYAPVTGGVDPSRSRLRGDMDRLCDVADATDLDRHIMQLLALHPSLRDRFGKHDLAALDVPTKQALLADMNDVLGIRPLRKS